MLVDRLNGQDLVSGTMALEFLVPALAGLASTAGLDFLVADMEHTGASFQTMKMFCATCRGGTMAPIIRVPRVAYTYIARAFDIGAHGVMIPMVETAEEARLIASSAHYPPVGQRGAAFGLAHDDYLPGDIVEKMAYANRRNITIAQIETAVGLNNVEEIAAVPGIDVLWVGHLDLSNFLGIPGQFDHPVFREALDWVCRAARKEGKTAGMVVADQVSIERAYKAGFRMLAFGVDHSIYQQALNGMVAEGKALCRQIEESGPRSS